MFLLNKFKFGQKIFLGFIIVTAIFISILVFIFFKDQNNNEIFKQVEHLSEQVDLTGRVQANFLLSRISVKNLILNKDISENEVYQERYNNTEKYFQDYKELEKDANHLTLARDAENLLLQYDTEHSMFIANQENILSGKSNEQIDASMKEMDQIATNFSDKVESLKLILLDEKVDLLKKYNNNLNILNTMIVISIVIGSSITIFISIIITRLVLKPILKLSETFHNLSEGDADTTSRLPVVSKDEIGMMSNNFNNFMIKLQKVYNEVRQQAVNNKMKSDIDAITRNLKSVENIAENIINYICDITKSNIGAIYVKSEKEYVCKGVYAKDNSFSYNDKLETDNGLSGQAIKDKKMININNLPENYFKINSGLGNANPQNMLILPCVILEEVVCLIEIAKFEDYSQEILENLKSISVVIAEGMNAVISREQIYDLYQKNLQQNEELAAQQEELRQSHDELNEYTNSLIEKDNELQVQSEEIRVTNNELEEKNKELENQKEEMILQNKMLEESKQELIEKAKALEITSKYKSEFLANVSHELRTPLNSILVLSELLMNKKNNMPLNTKEIKYAKAINTSGSELLTLITDILDLEKVEAGKIDIYKDNVSIAELKEYVLNTFNQIAESKQINFECTINTDKISIYTDELRLKQILKNLLANAFKFTEAGKVELVISNYIKNNNQYISFKVTDTGIGIKTEQLGVVFEAFKQANGTINRKFGGTGLGLSISKQLSELLGGEILAESLVEKGSTFNLIIPVNKEEDAINLNVKHDDIVETSEKFINVQDQNIPEKEKSVLIIEDDESFASILSEYANKKGFIVYVANEGETGLKLAKEKNPAVIIMDMGLPDVKGEVIIDELEKSDNTKNIPIHIISGFDTNEYSSKKNVFSFLKKPVTKKQIQKIFNELEEINIKMIKNILIISKIGMEIEAKLNRKNDIIFKHSSSAKEAYELIQKSNYDCIIMDKETNGESNIHFLEKLSNENKLNLPVIIYTDDEISAKEEEEFSKYTDSIIIRGAKSADRLISEFDMFLYNLNTNNYNKQKSIYKTMNQVEMDDLTGKTVLIVDDDVRNIFSLTGILESLGIKVIIARNGQDGIEKFTENSQIELVLMDIMMPVIDGYETIKNIRRLEKGKNIPIIALTAKSMPEDRAKCLEAGANEYTTKPILTEKLISLLRVWLYK